MKRFSKDQLARQRRTLRRLVNRRAQLRIARPNAEEIPTSERPAPQRLRTA